VSSSSKQQRTCHTDEIQFFQGIIAALKPLLRQSRDRRLDSMHIHKKCIHYAIDPIHASSPCLEAGLIISQALATSRPQRARLAPSLLSHASRFKMITILLVILVLMLLGAVPAWPHSRSWGYAPSGGLGLVVLILLILILTGRL
jgi:VIT1/CCC1 family predicted Fe2+/Mn2+ transporter